MIYNQKNNNYIDYDSNFYYYTQRSKIIKKEINYSGPRFPIDKNNIYPETITIQDKGLYAILIYENKCVSGLKSEIKLCGNNFIVKNILYDNELNVSCYVFTEKNDNTRFEDIILFNDKYYDINELKYFSKYEISKFGKKNISVIDDVLIEKKRFKACNPWFPKEEDIKIIIEGMHKLPKILIEKILIEIYQN